MQILFPTDFSDAAKNAFKYAIQFAQETGATIDLMHVYHLPFANASNVSYQQIDEMLVEKKEGVLKNLNQWKTDYAPDGLVNQVLPVYGIFLDHEITDWADSQDYDLIMMGTKGEHAAFEKMLGSVTTRTMMQAPCPVMAIPEGVPYRSIKQIAYATNFALADKKATKQLNDFALELGAKLHYVHIEKRKNVLGTDTSIRFDYYPTPFTDFTLLKNESVTAGLDDFIKREKIDLLTLFIPERRLWERLFHTSFTKKMTFHTNIPLSGIPRIKRPIGY